MAKGLRSKVKRRFRTELRERVGKPNVTKQEDKIQEELKKILEKPAASSSLLSLKSALGSKGVPATGSTASPQRTSKADNSMDVDVNENEEIVTKKTKKAVPLKKKAVKVKRNSRKKFFHFHPEKKIGEKNRK